MKAIFKPSKFDNPNKYAHEVEAEESVILVRSLIYKINQKILKKGAKYSFVDPLMYRRVKE